MHGCLCANTLISEDAATLNAHAMLAAVTLNGVRALGLDA